MSEGGKPVYSKKEKPRIALIADTDMHGGLSLAASWLALRKAGIEPEIAYSNFQLVPRGQEPTEPVTNAQWLEKSITKIVPLDFKGDIYILDIPANSMRLADHVAVLRQYVERGSRVYVVNKAGHESPEVLKMYMEAGIDYIPVESDYAVAMFIPRKLGIEDEEIKRMAKWAALADFDSSIESKVTAEEEELVTEIIDRYWKFESKKDPAIPGEYREKHGNVGSLARMIVENGLDWLENRAKELVKGIPAPEYEVVGDVAIVKGPDIPGLAWKLVAKACRISGAKVGVIVSKTPRGDSLIIATNWRWKAKMPQLIGIVDRVAQEIAGDRIVIGNPGARSIFLKSAEEAKQLIEQAVSKLNNYIQASAYSPETTTDKELAETLLADIHAFMQKLEEILQQQQKMYKEYQELKKRHESIIKKREEVKTK